MCIICTLFYLCTCRFIGFSQTDKKCKNPIDFATLKCYTTVINKRKEAAAMMRTIANAYRFATAYYFMPVFYSFARFYFYFIKSKHKFLSEPSLIA